MSKKRPAPLRIALVWKGVLLQDELLSTPQDVGFGPGQLLPQIDGVGPEPLLRVTKIASQLLLRPGMSGDVWLRGERKNLAGLEGPIQLWAGDYGVVHIGPVSVFFEHVTPIVGVPRGRRADRGALWAALLLAFLSTFGVLFIAKLDADRQGPAMPFELNQELVTRYLVEPPTEPMLEPSSTESGDETDDAGLRGREESGGRAHEGDEGRVGREDATQEQTEILGEPQDEVSARVRGQGLLGALSGGSEGNAIAAALDGPDIGELLGGTGAASTVSGRGSRGAGLRGLGMGGGGMGAGSLFGSGMLGTGVGGGRGGAGAGMGGIGARGRMSQEVRVSVMRGRARVNGYLSAEQIDRVVRANQAAVRYCYEVEVQRQPNLRGRVEIGWRINLQGRVTAARVAQSSLRNPRVEGCIVRQVRRWRFPQPDGGEVNVTYPFIFGVQGG